MEGGRSLDAIVSRVPTPAPAPRRSGRPRVWVAGLPAGIAAALGCAAALIALPGVTAERATRAAHSLASLPVAAWGPISAALGHDQPAYRVRGLEAINLSQRLRVGFSPRGVTVASGGAQLSMRLSAYGYASALAPLGPVPPHASANRVSYAYGSLSEWYANGPLGLEQGFEVGSRPDVGSGPLTLSLTLSGDLVPLPAGESRQEGSSLLFSGRGVALRYGGLLVTDARGRVLHSWLEPVGGRVLIRVDDHGARYPLRVDPFIQQAELTASDGATFNTLGWSTAVSGATIVVGAPLHENEGAAYVFTMPASGWANATQSAELSASDIAQEDHFGESVAISGNTIVVGAPYHTVASSHVFEQGAAYVFAMPEGGWGTGTQPQAQTAELSAADGEEGERLGESVAISGDTIVVGAPYRKIYADAERGAAYAFTMPASGWAGSLSQSAELTASDGAASDRLGSSVAISGQTIVAGAPTRKVGSNEQQGAVYMFTMPASGWAGSLSQSAELTASDGATLDRLGSSVAISGETTVAGAPDHEVDKRAKQGAAYVFTMPPSGWTGSLTQTAELTSEKGEEGEELGDSVAISDDTVLAGAYHHKVGSNTSQGATYLFAMGPAGWTDMNQTTELSAADGATEDELGRAVGISGNTIVAGAPMHKVGSSASQGAAYVFAAPLPSIAIFSPVDGATYSQGQAVAAGYACGAPAGATVTTCAGPVANGAPIETSAPGEHTFTVETTDSDGLHATQSAGYTVVAPLVTSPPLFTAPVSIVAPPVEPTLSSLNESAKTWREGNALAQISKKKLPVGTTFSFGLNVPARVTFTFTEPASGRKVRKRCVAQTKKNKKEHSCTRTVISGTLTFSAHAGTNKVHFEGSISKHKKLKLGSYTLLVAATASGKRSTTRALHFAIAHGL